MLSTARTGATATLMADGRILIVGGKDGNGNALASADALNPDGTTAPAPSMLIPRYGHSALLLNNGSVLVAGGHTTGGAVVNTAELFDPIANTWRFAQNTMVDSRAEFTLSHCSMGAFWLQVATMAAAQFPVSNNFFLSQELSNTQDLSMRLVRRTPQPFSRTGAYS